MIDDYCIDDGSESVSELTRQKVFERDGERCWMCESKIRKILNIAHQIPAVEVEAFKNFKSDGTLPATLTNLSHADNLFPLCSNCHNLYDIGAFPDWIMMPDIATIEKYITHEKQNYDSRLLLATQSTTSESNLRRTLPIINRTKVLYHPAIISPNLPLNTFKFSRWPKNWLGEPTTVIHRVARRGLLESSPVQPIFVGRGNLKVGWQRGVPTAFQLLIGELFRLWARPTPVTNGRKTQNLE